MRKVIKYLINLLLLISLVIMDYCLIDLSVIPTKYLLITGIVTFIIVIIFTLLIIKSKKIIISIIELLVILLSIFITSKIILASKFFDKVKNIEETTIYSVIVNVDSNYNSINDIIDSKIGIININSSSYDKAISSIKEYSNIEISKYNNIDMLLKDLFSNIIDAIIINSSSIDVINELDDTFNSKIRVINEIRIKESIEDNTNLTIKDPINILISGIDTYGSIDTVSRSDVNIIVTINPNTNEILLTSIPRDMHLYLHGIDDMMDKLTHSGYYGINMTKETIEDFLEIKIDYFVRVNFTSLIRFIDSIGGVDVYSDVSFKQS